MIRTRLGNPVKVISASVEELRSWDGELTQNVWVKVRREDDSVREYGVWDLRATDGLSEIMEAVFLVNPELRNTLNS